MFPARTSSRHAAIPPLRDEGAFTLLSSDRRPEFIRRGGTSEKRTFRSSFSTSYFLISNLSAKAQRAFTLLELLVVIGIVAILMVLVAPAFTNLKSAGDVTGAAYIVKGVLDQARTYAMANNTYTWVGFFEEDVSKPSTTPQATAGTGRIVMSVVASEDGTMIYNPSSPAKITTTQLIQVGKLTKIENVHLAGDALFTAAPLTPTGSTFNYRPAVTNRIASPPNASPPDSTTPFQYPVGNPEPAWQYTFKKAVQFSPSGEARIDNSTVDVNNTAVYPLQVAAEIGLRATHGTTVDTVSPNVVAIQFTGVGSSVAIYRK